MRNNESYTAHAAGSRESRVREQQVFHQKPRQTLRVDPVDFRHLRSRLAVFTSVVTPANSRVTRALARAPLPRWALGPADLLAKDTDTVQVQCSYLLCTH